MIASNGLTYEKDVEIARKMYQTDINFLELQKQLPMCKDMIKQALPAVKKVTLVRKICEAMNTQQVCKTMFSEIHNLLGLYLTIPITTATSEKAFSTLQRVLTYLRSSMTEQRLNQCIILHTHKHLTDSINLAEIGNEFISSNSERKHYFGLYVGV